MVNIDKVIDDTIRRMELGIIRTKYSKFYLKIHSNYNSHFEITPTLNIKDKIEFYNSIKEYISLFRSNGLINISEDFIKTGVVTLIANMSIDDFNNPNEYVRRAIDFKKNKLLEQKSYGYIDSLEGNLNINVRIHNVETPFCFESQITGEKGTYILPTICYGIANDTCYIYAMQNIVENTKTPYYKKIKRKLYKLNKDILENETEEYIEYINGISDYYPENISDVSPNTVLALTIFLNELEKHGINKVKAIPYLPVRYENRIKMIAHEIITAEEYKSLTKEEREKLFLELINKQMEIQSNITEKFIRTFYRVNHHFNNIDFVSLPMELDDGLHMKLSRFEYSDNEILNEVINKSNNKTL